MTDLQFHRRAPMLDGRLSAAVALAEDSQVFADIGADHGRLSAVMLLQDERRRALVADISPLALNKARTLILRLGLESRAAFAVANGLEALSAYSMQVDSIFILGMGGDTVCGILQRGKQFLNEAALILGAQTELPVLRKTLCEIGYRICREIIAHEAGRDYILLRALPALNTATSYSEEELILGPVLLKEKPENWPPMLIRRQRLLTQAIQAMEHAKRAKDDQRLALFKRELIYINNALQSYQKG